MEAWRSIEGNGQIVVKASVAEWMAIIDRFEWVDQDQIVAGVPEELVENLRREGVWRWRR